ncbi:MAG: alcohol dehydrogenase catalytic domain-containing protein [Bacillota bacterium]
MKALVIRNKYDIVLEDNFPSPAISDREVLIRVKAVGICGTDFKLYRGEYGDGYPLIPGHEFAGTVEKVGSAVKGVALGDRVTAVPSVQCGCCAYCLGGQYSQCENRSATGVLNHGAFAEYVKVPATNIFPIGSLSFRRATFAEPLACVVRAVERSGARLGERVLVLGTGTTGHLFARVLNGMGCDVYMLGRNPHKLRVAEEKGIKVLNTSGGLAEEELRPLSEKVNVLIDAIGDPRLAERFIPLLKKGGKLVVFGVSQGQLKLNYFEVYRKELQVIGTFSQQDKFAQAITMLQNNVLDVEGLITHEGGLEEVKEVLSGKKPENMIKFVACIDKE